MGSDLMVKQQSMRAGDGIMSRIGRDCEPRREEL